MSRADDLSRSLDLVRVVVSYGIELRREGAEHVACCPFHQEDTPSFRIYFDKPQNKQRWKCFGCSASGDVIDFVRDIEGLPDSRAAMDRLQAFDATAPLPPPTPKKQQPAMKTKTGKLLATYDYTDEVGELLFQVLRYEVLTETGEVVRGKKTFRQRQPDGNGGWLRNIDGVRRVLYRLPFLIAADTVWLTEGEKDVHSLESLGIVATTLPGGARATWDHGYTEALRGKHIVLCCDTDAPGQEHQARCLTHLRDAAASLSVCHLPELVKDVTEFIEAGQDPRELVRPWTPPAETPSPVGGPDPEPEPEPKPRPRPKRRTAVETTYSDTPPNADWMQHLIRNSTGSPKALLANAITAFRHAPEWQGRLHWNEFGLHVISRGALPWGAGGDGADRVWSDNEDRLAADWLQHHGIAVNPIVAAQAVQTVAHESPFHPVRRYLDFLSWDGEHRIEAWLQYYLGVKHSDLVAAFGSRWLISAVARVMSPGCKADCALVLEGRQGVYKSSAMRALASPWFSDHLPAVDSKDAQVQLAGVWVLELAELDAMKKTEVSAVKSFLSTTIDRYRPPYGTRAIDVPRQCVFVGTTNQDQWLRDETGNRRFWPARCEGRIRLDELARDRDQLWAEAVFRWREGATWWLDTPELNAAAAEEQAARLARDVWEELIVPWLDDAITPKDRIRISDVLRECVKRDQQQWTRSDEMRVAAILRGLGWTRKNVARGSADWRYFRPS